MTFISSQDSSWNSTVNCQEPEQRRPIHPRVAVSRKNDFVPYLNEAVGRALEVVKQFSQQTTKINSIEIQSSDEETNLSNSVAEHLQPVNKKIDESSSSEVERVKLCSDINNSHFIDRVKCDEFASEEEVKKVTLEVYAGKNAEDSMHTSVEDDENIKLNINTSVDSNVDTNKHDGGLSIDSSPDDDDDGDSLSDKNDDFVGIVKNPYPSKDGFIVDTKNIESEENEDTASGKFDHNFHTRFEFLQNSLTESNEFSAGTFDSIAPKSRETSKAQASQNKLALHEGDPENNSELKNNSNIATEVASAETDTSFTPNKKFKYNSAEDICVVTNNPKSNSKIDDHDGDEDPIATQISNEPYQKSELHIVTSDDEVVHSDEDLRMKMTTVSEPSTETNDRSIEKSSLEQGDNFGKLDLPNLPSPVHVSDKAPINNQEVLDSEETKLLTINRNHQAETSTSSAVLPSSDAEASSDGEYHSHFSFLNLQTYFTSV